MEIDAAPVTAPLGHQVFIDLYACDPHVIGDHASVRKAILTAAHNSGATIVTDVFHQFNPVGVSGVVVIAESHIAIHTWPEYRFAAVDVFTCGTSIDTTRLENSLRESFKAERTESHRNSRGLNLTRDAMPWR